MAISLKSRVSRNEIRLISVRDTSIDWTTIAEERQSSITECKEEYARDRKADMLKFKENEVPTVFCFTDPRNAGEYDIMQNLMIRMSNMNETKNNVESNRVIWEALYIGSFDAIWDGTPTPVNRDKKNKLNDSFIQSLIDARVYAELSIAIIGVFAQSMTENSSLVEESKS